MQAAEPRVAPQKSGRAPRAKKRVQSSVESHVSVTQRDGEVGKDPSKLPGLLTSE